MPTYHYVTADAHTDGGDVELPFADPEFGPDLNSGGEFNGVLDPKQSTLAAIEPAHRVLYIYRDDHLLWGGIVWELDPEGDRVRLTAAGFESYPGHVFYDESASYVYQDPLVISRAMWSHVQGKPDGNLGVTLDTATTQGKVKIGTPADPYKVAWWDQRLCGDVITDLASADDGFDWAVRVTQVGGTRYKRLVHGYPRLGRRTDLQFLTGVNIKRTVPIHIGAAATDVTVIGKGTGRNGRRQQFGVRDTGRLRVEASVSMKNEGSDDRLRARGRVELAALSYPHDVPEIVLHPHPSTPIGSFIPGDDVYVRVNDGWGDFEGWVRVMGYRIRPDAGEEVTVTCARADHFIYGPDPDIAETGS